MNILVLTSVYPQPDDTTPDVTATVKYFCKQWSLAGHNVLVIHNNSVFPYLLYKVPLGIQKKVSSKLGHSFPNAESRKKLKYKEDGVKVIRLPIKKLLPYSRFSKRSIARQVETIERILERNSFIPDVVLSHWVNPQIELAELLMKRVPAKYSLVFHGDCEKKQIETFDLREKIRCFDAVGCRNNSYAKLVQRRLELPHTPFVCSSGVPNDIAKKEYECIGTREYNKTREFIYVGRLVEYKNVDTIIEALSAFYNGQEFRLHIVGDGAEKAYLQKAAASFGVTDRIVFHGHLDRTGVFDLLKKSFCFIMVSNNETFGMVYIEAMLAGCITVASRGCGVDGIIRDGDNGFLSKQGDVKGLINTISRIEALSGSKQTEIRKEAIRTAYSFRDENVASDYLEDVLS